MTRPPPLVFPTSRVLAGWWRQLSPLRPRCLWIGHLLLHRVEALAGVAHSVPLDPLDSLLLKALAVAPEATARGVDTCLHLGVQVVHRALHGLASQGLAEAGKPGEWSLPPRGRQALEQGTYTRYRHERRVFHFLDSGRPGEPPRFLNLDTHETVAWPAADDWSFPVHCLLACVGQSAEWKQRHGFPLDVQEILGAEAPTTASAGQPAASQRVILDSPEHLLVALVLVPAETAGERLLCFAIRQDGWVLHTHQPAFTLESHWHEVFPELTEEPSPDAWRQAWLAWCQPRGLPALEAGVCTLERQGLHLRVTAPKRLVERLRAARGDAMKAEAWLLAGSGWLQTAALIEVVESGGG